MEVITDEIAERGLRRKALALWILSGALVAVTIGSILFYRNPWLVHRMDASQATTEVLGQIADSRSPYIKIEYAERLYINRTGCQEERDYRTAGRGREHDT